ncbi:hypothetical protein LG311_10400 [Sutcliffiella horikoshii]|uniref:hypothetical protein n=1 Tax=Sutcliffiella horikoshii TaxID=79883 RepID=UPI001CBE6339|nr:hypothetical protein [Sutcliffiella horikoshii]UAL49285.1 hypothetical protein K7887_10265 [Sutcliffiella horikoshii]
MSPMAGVINLIIFLGIIIFVFLLLTRGVKFTTSIKKNSLILSGYIIILLCSMVIYFLMPEAEHMEWKGEGAEESSSLLYERLMNKEDIEEDYLSSKKLYELSGQELEIKVQDNYTPEYMVMFERTPDLEGEIEVILYKGLLFIEEFDLSNELPPPTMEFSNDLLEIVHPTFFEKNMAYTAPEFPFTQFSGERSSMQGYGRSSRDAIIYVKVPEDVEVIWNEEYHNILEVK